MKVPKHFSGAVQLLGKELAKRKAPRLRIMLPPEPGLPDLLTDEFPTIHVDYLDYATYAEDLRSRTGSGVTLAFGLDPAPESPVPDTLTVVFYPKEKELAELVFSWVAARLSPGDPIVVLGPNRGGIRSAGGLVERYLGTLSGRRAARHAVLLTASRGNAQETFEGRREFTISHDGRNVRIVSLPGVFSHGELDPGTELLLETLGTPPFARALDWGCGSGALGTALQLQQPEGSMDFVDTSAQALAATRLTLLANKLNPESRVFASDGFSEVTGDYDLIVTNPPFHEGIRTTTQTTHRIIAEARGHLTESGRFVLVANTFLKYTPVLRQHFSSVRTLAENSRFRVLEASLF